MSFIRKFTSRPILIFGLVSLLVVGSVVLLSRPAQVTQAQPPVISGCQIFPADNIWNVPITNLPVDPNSATYINTIGATRGLHPDFGSSTDPQTGVMYGIPYVTVPSNQATVPVTFDINDESDPGPGGWLDPPNNTITNYPIPTNVPLNDLIEGGNNGGDQHVLVVQQGTCKLYETWNSRPNPNSSNWLAGSGAIFDLNSNALRPDTWTSADAAGLPVLAGLARYDEAASGSINHALRFTVQCANGKVWPARHITTGCSAGHAPMGQRFRLKASYVIPSNYSPQTKAILQALKTYGMIVADNGSNWFISGQPNAGWDDNSLVPELSAVKGSNFEAVNSSSLMIPGQPDSGKAAVAPTSAPSGLAVSVFSASQLNLSWTNTAPNTTGYRVERSLSPTSGFAEITTTLVGAPSYQNTALADGTTYYYRVRAYNAYGNGAYSNVANNTTTWIDPTGLAATAFFPNQINLSWNDNSSGEAGYYIERKITSVGSFAVIATTSSNINSYQDKGLVDGTSYDYRVRAFNSSGNSAYSTLSNVLTLLAPPSNLLAWATSTTVINLQWSDKSQSELGYVVERMDSINPWAQVGSTTAANVTTFTDNFSLAADTQYFYRVRASKSPLFSTYSNVGSAITTVLQVTVATDNGLGDTPNTLSYALNPANVSAGQTVLITTNVVINAVAWNPTIPAGITLVGNSGCGTPTITIDGSSTLPNIAPNLANGLVLNQTTLINLKVMHFPGTQIKNSGTSNKLVCTQAVK